MMRFWNISAVALAFAAVAGVAQAQKGGTPALLPGGNSKDPISINAAKLDFFDKEQKLVYSGGVVATQGPSQLKATTLTIFLVKEGEADSASKAAGGTPSASGNSVKRMEATGPVSIVSKDQVGTGDNLVYDKPANKVYLSGHAVLSQGPNITKGDTLTYDLTSSTAVVTGNVQSVFTPGSGGDSASPGGDKKPKLPKAK